MTWLSPSLWDRLQVPFPSPEASDNSPSSFLKPYENRGKRIVHVSVGHKGHLGLALAPELKKKKKNQEMNRERQILTREGRPTVEVTLPGQCLAFERRPWEAATGNADRNKSVRPTLLSVVQ